MTTVRQPIHEMGAAALRMLLRIQAEPAPPDSWAPREELATRLVERKSTGPLPEVSEANRASIVST